MRGEAINGGSVIQNRSSGGTVKREDEFQITSEERVG